MDTCEYKCIPENDDNEITNLNFNTYNEAFMLVNSDKIIQKIKQLFKHRFFYRKQDLFAYINIPKKYPTVQIYSALTQMINDNTEFIVDKYNRTGYLINIGDYYLFQPSELNYKNISLYDEVDYMFFTNANMIFNQVIEDKEIIPKEQENYLVSVEHPGFYNNFNPYN